MKFISLSALALLIGMGVYFYSQKTSLNQQQRDRLELVLSEYVRQLHLKNFPDASPMSDLKVQLVNGSKTTEMTAPFSYTFTIKNESGGFDSTVKKGHFILTSPDGFDWTASLKTDSAELEFSEPLSIKTTKK